MNTKMNKKNHASDNRESSKSRPSPSGMLCLPAGNTVSTGGVESVAKPRNCLSGIASTGMRSLANRQMKNADPAIRQVGDDIPLTSGAGNISSLVNKYSGDKGNSVKRQAGLAIHATPSGKGTSEVVALKVTLAELNHMAKPTASDARPFNTTITAASSYPRKHIRPSRRYYRIKRSAFRILERLKDKKEDLTEKQTDSKAWAESFISEDRKKVKMDFAQRKSKRSKEGVSIKAKISKVAPTQMTNGANRDTKRSFAKTVKECCIRAVIDRSSYDGAISQANWDLVNIGLCKVYRDILNENPGSPPSCSDAGWYQSHIKLIRCADQRSADLYTLAINRLGQLWPGACLDVVLREDIPKRPKARAWIPDFHIDPEEVLELIKLGNPELPTSGWKVVKIGQSDGNRRLAVIILNEESLTPLAKQKWRINYGFQALTLHLHRRDVVNKGT
ncbi:uncharacterized protein LOC128864462 [Anastrepha ludens]|uniref:uncharacterized protein LOC128864462 n=1 Tax=Anastrepha ludens TaxID=28586 RepID=UPI0023B1D45D|nr:uncharacterized protein LOC128864462 [Anastrepha ludens]